jgi:hypothetical protein
MARGVQLRLSSRASLLRWVELPSAGPGELVFAAASGRRHNLNSGRRRRGRRFDWSDRSLRAPRRWTILPHGATLTERTGRGRELPRTVCRQPGASRQSRPALSRDRCLCEDAQQRLPRLQRPVAHRVYQATPHDGARDAASGGSSIQLHEVERSSATCDLQGIDDGTDLDDLAARERISRSRAFPSRPLTLSLW